MSIIISLFLLGISLSMDTFSISLSIGTFNISQRKVIFLTLLIGLMHFLMPVFGFFLGNKIITFLKININFLLALILIFIAVEMIMELYKKEQKVFDFNFFNMIIIALTVSFDSFSTGIGLMAITNNYILSGFIFSMCASLFTYLGFLIGRYSQERLGQYAQIIGISILIILGIYHLFL